MCECLMMGTLHIIVAISVTVVVSQMDRWHHVIDLVFTTVLAKKGKVV